MPSACSAPSAAVWRRTAAAVALLVVVSALPSLPRGASNWDNIVKLQVARGLLQGNGFGLDVLTPDDAQYVLRGKDGRRFSGYLPLAIGLHVVTLETALLTGFQSEAVPALLLLGLVAAALVSWGRFAGAPRGAAVAGAVLACLGTALWPMAAHGYDVLVEVLALALLLRAGSGDRGGHWLVAGLAMSGALATRIGAVTLAAPAAALVLLAPTARARWKRAALLGLGVAPGIALVLWYNAYRFGSPWTLHQDTALGGMADLAAPWFSALHLEGMAGLLLSPGKGLFWYSPPLLLAAAVAPALVRRHRTAAVALAVHLVATVLLVGRFRYWHGDWGWGPRYLAPVLLASAPLAWLVSERIEGASRLRRAVALSVLLGLVTLQIAPVVGRPIPTHFALVVQPLAKEGRLATTPITRPPGPADYGIQYFAPQHSMLVSLARGLAESSGPEIRRRFGRGLLVPAAAMVLVALASFRRPGRRNRSGDPSEGAHAPTSGTSPLAPVRRRRATSSVFEPDWLLQRTLCRDTRAALREIDRGRLLDLGCGERPYATEVAPGVRVVGVDVPGPASTPDVRSLGSALPFRDATFEAVLCTQVLEHVPDPAAVLAEVSRVLRDGGRLVLSAPEAWFLHEEPHDYYRFTRYGLAALCRAAGLEPVEIRTQGGFFALAGIFLAAHLGSHARWFAHRAGAGGKDPGRWRRWIVPLKLPLALANLFLAALDAIPHPGIVAVNHLVVARRPARGRLP